MRLSKFVIVENMTYDANLEYMTLFMGGSEAALTSLRMIVVVEVKADEGLAEELGLACGVLRDRKALHDDSHGVLEALPDSR